MRSARAVSERCSARKDTVGYAPQSHVKTLSKKELEPQSRLDDLSGVPSKGGGKLSPTRSAYVSDATDSAAICGKK